MNESDYEQAVDSFYEGLYRFGFSLAGNADDACELTQETFARLLSKGGQVRDRSKIKGWLFTTLYRTYLGWKRQEIRHPHVEITEVEDELPPIVPEMVDQLENDALRDSLLEIDERYRAPLALYYFENLSYREISKLLDVPVGTALSRIARGKELIRRSLIAKSNAAGRKIISINPTAQSR